MKKILHLTLTKKWFALILKRKKHEEYRVAKQYWIRRLTTKFDLLNKELAFRHYDEIIFKNGYSKTAPTIRIECKGISYILSISSMDEALAPTIREPLFVIALGRILETKHLKAGGF